MTSKILYGGDLKLCVEKTSLGQFFFDSATQHADKICQIDAITGEKETFKNVKQRSIRLAIQLQKREVTPNDVIVFCSQNNLDVTIAVVASCFIGAKIANLEPSLSIRNTKHLLELVNPKIVFVEEPSIELIENSLKQTNLNTEIIVLGNSPKYPTFSNLVQQETNDENFQPTQVNINDIALMLFSSGTTGLPKAICHSHYTYIYATNQLFATGAQQAFLHFTTFYWMTGLLMLTCSFKAGSYRVFGRNPSAEDVFKIIEKYKIHTCFMAPVLTYKLTRFDEVNNFDTSSLKLLFIGGTPIAPLQLQRTKKLFKHSLVTLCYGMSEIGYISSFTLEDDPEFCKRKSESCGKLIQGITLKMVDPDTEQILGPNEKGELRIKSLSIMKGYYNADCSSVFDSECYLKTGDIGYYDDEGCIFVIERIKEMFKYQSWHIVPSVVESALLEHPAIKEAAVFGLPCGEDGEMPAACVVLNENFTLNISEINKFMAERVADREMLRGGITVVKNLAKTPTGKLIRKQIRNLFINSSSKQE